MHSPASPALLPRLAARAYQGFLLLYPAVFRGVYGSEMETLFETRCTEAYAASGLSGMGRWLVKIMLGEVASLIMEHREAMNDTLHSTHAARSAFVFGSFFLAGTWVGLFFLPGGTAAGGVLVLANALLAARAMIRSQQQAYVAGMAAMANTVLIAGLMAVQAGLGPLHQGLAGWAQGAVLGLHGLLLWNLRGDDLSRVGYELESGG